VSGYRLALLLLLLKGNSKASNSKSEAADVNEMVHGCLSLDYQWRKCRLNVSASSPTSIWLYLTTSKPRKMERWRFCSYLRHHCCIKAQPSASSLPPDHSLHFQNTKNGPLAHACVWPSFVQKTCGLSLWTCLHSRPLKHNDNFAMLFFFPLGS
jgi:hypothetical protein